MVIFHLHIVFMCDKLNRQQFVTWSKKEKDDQLIKPEDDKVEDEDNVAIENPIYDIDPDEKPCVVTYHKAEDDDEEDQVKV